MPGRLIVGQRPLKARMRVQLQPRQPSFAPRKLRMAGQFHSPLAQNQSGSPTNCGRYLARNPDERITVDHVTQFVRANPDCFERSCRDGHVTGSAWILSHDRTQFLLTHHKKLGRWLQLGGHAAGEHDL